MVSKIVTNTPYRVSPATVYVTPEIDLDMLKKPNENTWVPTNTKGVLHSQYETVIAEAIVDHLKALFGRVNNKPYYKTPSCSNRRIDAVHLRNEFCHQFAD